MGNKFGTNGTAKFTRLISRSLRALDVPSARRVKSNTRHLARADPDGTDATRLFAMRTDYERTRVRGDQPTEALLFLSLKGRAIPFLVEACFLLLLSNASALFVLGPYALSHILIIHWHTLSPSRHVFSEESDTGHPPWILQEGRWTISAGTLFQVSRHLEITLNQFSILIQLVAHQNASTYDIDTRIASLSTSLCLGRICLASRSQWHLTTLR